MMGPPHTPSTKWDAALGVFIIIIIIITLFLISSQDKMSHYQGHPNPPQSFLPVTLHPHQVSRQVPCACCPARGFPEELPPLPSSPLIHTAIGLCRPGLLGTAASIYYHYSGGPWASEGGREREKDVDKERHSVVSIMDETWSLSEIHWLQVPTTTIPPATLRRPTGAPHQHSVTSGGRGSCPCVHVPIPPVLPICPFFPYSLVLEPCPLGYSFLFSSISFHPLLLLHPIPLFPLLFPLSFSFFLIYFVSSALIYPSFFVSDDIASSLLFLPSLFPSSHLILLNDLCTPPHSFSTSSHPSN